MSPRICLSERWSSSSPSKRTEPPRTASASLMRPMIERDSTVLPEPDSPTTPIASPRAIDSDTPSTARTTPRGVRKWVTRSETSSSGVTSDSETAASAPVCT